MISLIDADLVAFRCAASCEKQGVVVEDLGVAQGRANELLRKIVETTSPEQDHILVLSGPNNFRKKINPEYKANRKDQVEPRWLRPLREWLVETWGAEVTSGIEADDQLGILQTKYGDSSVICTLDKDLRQVPGWHYSWEISGTSVKGLQWVRPEEILFVSPQEGLFNFYWQLIMGDAADNVFGFDGKARQKVPQFLESYYHEMQAMASEQELFDFVRDKYNDDGRFLTNGVCLWVQRKEGDNWLDHAQNIMAASGPREDLIPLLPLLSEPVPDDGPPSLSA
jgi:5'-3' exonuclease